MRAAAASHGANAFVSYAAVETRSGAKVPVDVQGVSAQEMQEMQEMQEVQEVQDEQEVQEEQDEQDAQDARGS